MNGKDSLSQEIVILFYVIAALVFAITANAGEEAMFMITRSLGRNQVVAMIGIIQIPDYFPYLFCNIENRYKITMKCPIECVFAF